MPIGMRRSLVALMVLFGLLVVPVQRVSAECMDGYPSADAADYRGYVFSGTVVGVSESPTQSPPAGSSPFTYEVTLDVVRGYRGRVNDPLLINGWYAGCSRLDIRGLRVGDQLLIAFGGADPAKNRTLYGSILVWHKVAGGWRFYESALQYGADNEYYPPAARSATTTREVLALVGSGAPPDTGTLPERLPNPDMSAEVRVALLAIAIATLLAAIVAGPRRRLDA